MKINTFIFNTLKTFLDKTYGNICLITMESTADKRRGLMLHIKSSINNIIDKKFGIFLEISSNETLMSETTKIIISEEYKEIADITDEQKMYMWKTLNNNYSTILVENINDFAKIKDDINKRLITYNYTETKDDIIDNWLSIFSI